VKAVFTLLLLTITGCAQLDVVKSQGAKIYDKTLIEAEDYLCNVASVGSIKRRYGNPERAKVYSDLCKSNENIETLIK